MSIAFNKKDYKIYDSEDDESSSEDEELHQTTKNIIATPNDWIDRLYSDLKYMAKDRAIPIFENLDSEILAEFASSFSDTVYK